MRDESLERERGRKKGNLIIISKIKKTNICATQKVTK